MLDACETLAEFIEGRNETDLQMDKMLLSAVTRQIEIIGEAANMITVALRETHPEIQWKEIIGMRNKIIHEYFAVQTDTVWDVVKYDVPILRKQLIQVIQEVPEGNF